MALGINHNPLSVVSAHYLSRAYDSLAVSTEHLASGLRINHASDDPAGLAVRELMRADIASLAQGVRNTNDAISLLQTADGGMSVIDEKLIRMKELSTQAATGTYTQDQRIIIDSEYQAMANEITRIATATDFNGIYLLNGNLSSSSHDGTGLTPKGKLKIHFGAGNNTAEDYYYIQIGLSTASALGVGSTTANTNGKSISTQALAQKALDQIDKAIVSKDKIRANLGTLQNRFQNTIQALQIQGDNLQVAESRISDVDIATEMANYVRSQILMQSGSAMLSQANTLPQLALKLLM